MALTLGAEIATSIARPASRGQHRAARLEKANSNDNVGEVEEVWRARVCALDAPVSMLVSLSTSRCRFPP
jgi:hypothetical protein